MVVGGKDRDLRLRGLGFEHRQRQQNAGGCPVLVGLHDDLDARIGFELPAGSQLLVGVDHDQGALGRNQRRDSVQGLLEQ